jgi:hypothetical protein
MEIMLFLGLTKMRRTGERTEELSIGLETDESLDLKMLRCFGTKMMPHKN